jgi:hypothetical protein
MTEIIGIPEEEGFSSCNDRVLFFLSIGELNTFFILEVNPLPAESALTVPSSTS